MSDRLLVVSTDCHAGLPIHQYKPYVETKYHDFIDMAVDIQVDMMDKAEQQFLIKGRNQQYFVCAVSYFGDRSCGYSGTIGADFLNVLNIAFCDRGAG